MVFLINPCGLPEQAHQPDGAAWLGVAGQLVSPQGARTGCRPSGCQPRRRLAT